MADLLNVVWKWQPIGDGWDIAPDPVIWISVRAMDAAWSASEDYIAHGGEGSLHVGRYGQFAKFFVDARFIAMPTVLLDDEGAVSFTNGRHRFARLRDQGLAALPIEVPVSRAALFTTRFGTSDRVGVVSK
ncbi:hypothetical protein SAMN05446635_6033 [Burkholderia sp. OK233]|nr:hypothetical protein SAMN05446635_6033 [Burkholderia sp. OK233]